VTTDLKSLMFRVLPPRFGLEQINVQFFYFYQQMPLSADASIHQQMPLSADLLSK